jgi:hypothetical protein
VAALFFAGFLTNVALIVGGAVTLLVALLWVVNERRGATLPAIGQLAVWGALSLIAGLLIFAGLFRAGVYCFAGCG